MSSFSHQSFSRAIVVHTLHPHGAFTATALVRSGP
jgi:hypothetical protein